MTLGCPAELLCCFSGFFSNSAWIPSSRIIIKKKKTDIMEPKVQCSKSQAMLIMQEN